MCVCLFLECGGVGADNPAVENSWHPCKQSMVKGFSEAAGDPPGEEEMGQGE